MKNGKWRGVLAAFSGVALLWGAQCVVSPAVAGNVNLLARARAAGVIRIANTQSSPPWSMLGDDDKPTGYDVAVALEVAKCIGVPKVRFIADTYKNFVEGLKTDKYDLVMNDLTPTAVRKEQVDFSVPYGVEIFRIFVRKDNADITSKASLKGKRIGVSTGSSNDTWARSHLPGSDIRGYDNSGLIFNDIANGRIDAVIISHFGGLRHAAADRVPVKEVGEPLTYQLSAAAMAKGQPALRAAVDKALSGMLADGTIGRLGAKYIGKDYDMAGSIKKAEAQLKASGE